MNDAINSHGFTAKQDPSSGKRGNPYSFPMQKKVQLEPLIKKRCYRLAKLPDWIDSANLNPTSKEIISTRIRYSFPMPKKPSL